MTRDERPRGRPVTEGPAASGADPSPPAPLPQVAASRLIGTLAVAGALAGFGIVFVHQWAEPRIQAHRAAVLATAIQEVLGGPDSYETLWVADGGLVAEPPAGADTASADRVYLGRDATGEPVGFAIAGELPGYQDVIRLIFGYDPDRDRVTGMKVLESKETPGLGDRIEKDSSFLGEFAGVEPPLEGVKAGAGRGGEREVDMISGATISSRTVIAIINRRLEELRSALDAYVDRPAASPAPSAAMPPAAPPATPPAAGQRERTP